MGRVKGSTALGLALVLASAGLGWAQSGVEIQKTPDTLPRFEIVPIDPEAKNATRPRDADFYGDDVHVRYEPAFIEPFVGHTAEGNEYGLSGWTAPSTPVGSLASQNYQQSNGAFSLGFTFVFDYPPKVPPRRPASAPR